MSDTPLTDAEDAMCTRGHGTNSIRPCDYRDMRNHARTLERALRLLAEQAAIGCTRDECCVDRIAAWRVSAKHAEAVCAECQLKKALEKAREEQ